MKLTAEKAKKTLMFNFNNRARPESYAMMDYVADGTIGTINSCQAKWIRRAGIPGFGGWFTTKAMSGGGPLIDLLHMVDLGMHFMGYPEPAHVLARTYQDHISNKAFKGPWGIPDVANGTTERFINLRKAVDIDTKNCDASLAQPGIRNQCVEMGTEDIACRESSQSVRAFATANRRHRSVTVAQVAHDH